MRKLKHFFVFFLLISFNHSTFSQEKSSENESKQPIKKNKKKIRAAKNREEGGTGPKQQTLKSKRKIHQIQRKEAKEKRRKERAERQAVKVHHLKLQTKKVRKRMKRSKRRANLNNDNRRESGIVRFFKRKKKT